MPASSFDGSPKERALVTGGSGGLGSAICLALAGSGHAVAVGYRTRRAVAEGIAEEIRASNGCAVAIGFDVSDAHSAESAVEDVAEALGGLSVVIHAAARNADGLLADLSNADVAEMLAVNVTGAVHVTRAALPWLLRSGRGRIVHMSSILAHRSTRGVAAYAATKGAIESLTRALAVELGPKGITVNAVAPGYIDAGLGRAPVRAAGDLLKSLVPARRAGTPEEVAAVVAFLVSPEAAYVNGAVIPVDGGLLAGSSITAGARHPQAEAASSR